MQISNDTTTGQTGTNTTTARSGTDALANKEVFLQMLVAQIKNQDPLNPTDGAAFMTQLAQFSQLEQLIGIRQELTPATTTTNTTTTDPGTSAATSQTPAIAPKETAAI